MIIRYFTYAAVAFTLVSLYLKMNKIWKRKGDPEVASSLSIVALSISATINTIWAVNFMIHSDTGAVVDNMLLVIESVFLITIGAGAFVREKKKLSFWQRLVRALKTEREEAGFLLHAMSGRNRAEETVSWLHQLAAIDGQATPTETRLIGEFAEFWRVPYAPAELDGHLPEVKEQRFDKLRSGVEGYLGERPSPAQVTQVAETMQRLVRQEDLLKAPKSDVAIGWDIVMLVLTVGSLGLVGYVYWRDLTWADPEFQLLAKLDLAFIVLCAIEFLVRLAKAPSKADFLEENWCDLPGLVPMYVESFAWLRAARILRVMRVVRLLRLVNAGRRMKNAALTTRRKPNEDEVLMLAELQTMMKEYTEEQSKAAHEVLIIPQEQTQAAMLLELRPDMPKISYEGGFGYLVGSFSTRPYADMVSKEWRGKQLMTVVLSPEGGGEMESAH